MKSLIESNFKDDINDNTNINFYIINILYKILCFLDYILIITSKNENLYY
jgi:hypothetical protein